MRNRICKYPGCYRFVVKDYCELHAELGEDRDKIAREARERYDRERLRQTWADLKANKAHDWYNTRAWRTQRASILRERPYCEQCGREDCLEVHHIRKAASFEDFLDAGNLMVLCRECHKQITAAQMRAYRS